MFSKSDWCMRSKCFALLTIILFGAIACMQKSEAPPPNVRLGSDVLADNGLEFLNGKRVGLITNQTGLTSDGRHVADLLAQNANVELVALMGPEHGIRGDAEAGAKVDGARDAKTGVPIFSLYGQTRKPTPEMLKGLDALVFDIQDIGTRFYTYISTMSLAMEAAAEAGLMFVVLDRPNPIGGHLVEGPVLAPEHKSFVGIHPIPLRHGMTVGELARLFNEEGWLANGVKANLQVVRCEGWRRNMIFRDYGSRWVPPSPNIPTPESALLYPGTGLIETLRTFSEGRGTEQPFEMVGAPWLNSEVLISALTDAGIAGVAFEPATFTPVDIPGKATGNKYDQQLCNGVHFVIQDGHKLPAVRLGFELLVALQKHFPQQLEIKQKSVERLTGQSWIYESLLRGVTADTIAAKWQDDLDKFMQVRSKYLLYE